jgi:hypothetical protein
MDPLYSDLPLDGRKGERKKQETKEKSKKRQKEKMKTPLSAVSLKAR